MNQQEMDKWTTAYHEAGHAIVIHQSLFFDLKDPAILLTGAAQGNLAQAAISGPARSSWTADVARDFSVISFGGYVAQSMLESLRGWKCPQEGCHEDYRMMTEALNQFGIYGEHPAHLNKCIEIIYPQIDKLKELAEVIFKSDVDVPKADVLAVLA